MRARQFLLVAILSLTASAARAEMIDVSDFHGGLVSTYQTQWSTLAARGVKVRIVGPCVSACTILVGYIPRNNICIMPNAYLGFHWATTDFHTQEMWSVYPPDIRASAERKTPQSHELSEKKGEMRCRGVRA